MLVCVCVRMLIEKLVFFNYELIEKLVFFNYALIEKLVFFNYALIEKLVFFNYDRSTGKKLLGAMLLEF
jgi:hypothetical protein